MRPILKIIFVLLVCTLFIGNINAQGQFGLKTGLGIDPGQFVIGGQVELTKGLGIFHLIPNLELGLGSTSGLYFNVNFVAMFRAERSSFGLYLGGAPTLALSEFDDLGLGLNAIVGTQLRFIRKVPTNLELRIGIGDKIPDFRILLTFLL